MWRAYDLNNILDFKLCSGCFACAQICPKDAIIMEIDDKGYYHPRIDIDKCVSCGLCKKVCGYNTFENHFDPEKYNEKCFAAKNKDFYQIKSSRSGGVFISLAKEIIRNNGVVYGVAMNNYVASHIRVVKEEDLEILKGSKYIQSNVNNTFLECEKDLCNGKKILFTGTGCQIESLIRFLTIKKCDLNNIIFVDIICHGVASPENFSYYYEYIKEHFDSEINRYNFRDKDYGWIRHIESWYNNSGKKNRVLKPFYPVSYYQDACYECPFTTPGRNSDITLGDYWGIENNVPEFTDNFGTSIIITHTCKGETLINMISDDLNLIETNLLNSLQPQLCHPSEKPKDYYSHWSYRCDDIDEYIKRIYFTKTYEYAIKDEIMALINKLRSIKKSIIRYFRK